MPEKQAPARDRLLLATALLTYEGGVGATGVDAIAKAAGVTKRTLYQHFGSKDALVAASLELRDQPAVDALRGAVERRIAKGARPVEALFAVLGRLLEGAAPRGCAFMNAALEVADREHPLHPVAAQHLDRRRALVADVLAQEGVTDPDVVDGVVLLAEGVFAVGGARGAGGADVAARAGRAAVRLVDGERA